MREKKHAEKCKGKREKHRSRNAALRSGTGEAFKQEEEKLKGWNGNCRRKGRKKGIKILQFYFFISFLSVSLPLFLNASLLILAQSLWNMCKKDK